MTEDEILEAAAQIICRKNGWHYWGGNDKWLVAHDYRACTRPKKNGGRCGKDRVHWPDCAELPDPRACHVHLTDEEWAFLDAARARVVHAALTAGQVPACWGWPVPEHCSFKTPDNALQFLRWWNKVCAACGADQELVLDHDHKTALIRGYICRSCNRQETYYGPESLIGRYRLRTPAMILGIYMRYSGWGGEAQPAPLPATAAETRAAVDRLSLPLPDGAA